MFATCLTANLRRLASTCAFEHAQICLHVDVDFPHLTIYDVMLDCKTVPTFMGKLPTHFHMTIISLNQTSIHFLVFFSCFHVKVVTVVQSNVMSTIFGVYVRLPY